MFFLRKISMTGLGNDRTVKLKVKLYLMGPQYLNNFITIYKKSPGKNYVICYSL